ncbi:hypothetical protein [Nevskia soli]|uniref:hypothetical protein n=1 Tax=Nevskia soli TaxID=418856 RepID=UPI0004A6B117|nr:hypothetical protein [Nevskia soli]
MSDLIYDKHEFEALINEVVPLHQQEVVLKALDIQGTTHAEFDDIGLTLTGEKRQPNLMLYTGAPGEVRESMWAYVKVELYDYLCTSSKKYSGERKEAGLTVKNVVTIVATAIGAHLNLALGVVTGAVIVALMSALKVGKNAWCEANKPASKAH